MVANLPITTRQILWTEEEQNSQRVRIFLTDFAQEIQVHEFSE
jgi:hypothetical protein